MNAQIQEYDDKGIKVMWDENDGWITQEDCCEDCGVLICDEDNCDCKKSCDNGNCNGGRAFRVANNDKMFCCPCCLNKGLNLKPTDEDYWTDEYCDCDDCKKNRKNKKK